MAGEWFAVAAAGLAFLALAFGWFVGRRRALSAAVLARREATRLHAQLADVRVIAAVAESQRSEAVGRQSQLAELLQRKDQQLLEFERERARHDHEFRQVSLLAARVPDLEASAAEAVALRAENVQLAQRVANLEPLAREVDLRDQYIESLHRQVVQRDERIFRQNSRHLADVLRGQRSGLAKARSAADEGDADPGVPPFLPMANNNGPAAAIDLRDVSTVAAASAESTGGGGGVVARRALSQALAGLGVDSFADLACLDNPEPENPSDER